PEVVVAHRLLQAVDRLGIEQVELAFGAPLVQAADRQRVPLDAPLPERRAGPSPRLSGNAARCRTSTSGAITSMPMPPTRDGVQVKYSSITSWRRPTASNTCAPR